MKLFKKILEAVKIKARKLPAPFQDRQPDIQLWRDCFAGDFALADRILCLFCDAFMFASGDRHRFRPDDTVWEIYRAVYPSRETPDCLENNFFIKGLEKAFAIKFDDARLETIESFQQIVVAIKRAQQSTGGNAGSPRALA